MRTVGRASAVRAERTRARPERTLRRQTTRRAEPSQRGTRITRGSVGADYQPLRFAEPEAYCPEGHFDELRDPLIDPLRLVALFAFRATIGSAAPITCDDRSGGITDQEMMQ